VLRKDQLCIRLKEFKFFEVLVYLGFVVSKDGLHMDQEEVKVILDWPMPHSVRGEKFK
jgi:hypothetical protein